MFYVTKDKQAKSYLTDCGYTDGTVEGGLFSDWSDQFETALKFPDQQSANEVAMLFGENNSVVWEEEKPSNLLSIGWKVVGDHTKWEIEPTNCDCRVCYMSRGESRE